MKKITNFIFLLLFITVSSGCGEEYTVGNDSNKTSTSKNDFAIINSLGLDTTTIVDKGEYYLVEGDIMIMKNKIQEYKNILKQLDKHNALQLLAVLMLRI